MADNDWTSDGTSEQELATSAQLSINGAFAAAGKSAVDTFGLPVSFDAVDDIALDFASNRGAELVGKKWINGQLVDNPQSEWAIEETTRDEVNGLLQVALREGTSYQEFSARLEESGIFSDARADMVARSEIAQAMIGGKKAAMSEGDVEYVFIFDGTDDDCELGCLERNETVIPVDEFELLHPNCAGDIRPATKEELADAGYGEEEAA
jgi:hypothetical protein